MGCLERETWGRPNLMRRDLGLSRRFYGYYDVAPTLKKGRCMRIDDTKYH